MTGEGQRPLTSASPQAGPKLYRRVRLAAIWRRPKPTARGDPDHDHVAAGIVAPLPELPRRAVVLPAGPSLRR
jgi:hypothetical protein